MFRKSGTRLPTWKDRANAPPLGESSTRYQASAIPNHTARGINVGKRTAIRPRPRKPDKMGSRVVFGRGKHSIGFW